VTNVTELRKWFTWVFAHEEAPETPASRPPVRHRVIAAVAVGVLAGLFSFLMEMRPGSDPDFAYPHSAARHFVAGDNPYEAMDGPPGSRPPYDQPLFYPFTTVLLLVPLAALPTAAAIALFFGLSSAALAYCITRDGLWRLHIFASAPFVFAATLGQFSPLLMVMAFTPWAGFLAAIKPNIGLALFLRRPTIHAVVGSLLFLGLSLIVFPGWPTEWLDSLRRSVGDATHRAPILQMGGFALVLAVVAWRRAAGRLLLVLSVVPQALFFYDQLPLWLIPATRQQSIFLTAVSQLGMVLWYLSLDPNENVILAAYPFIVPFLFLPALGILLWQRRGARP
jgi:hypothetical protein